MKTPELQTLLQDDIKSYKLSSESKKTIARESKKVTFGLCMLRIRKWMNPEVRKSEPKTTTEKLYKMCADTLLAMSELAPACCSEGSFIGIKNK